MIIPIVYPSAAEFWLQGTHEELYCIDEHSNLTNLPANFTFEITSNIAKCAAKMLNLSLPLSVCCSEYNDLRITKSFITQKHSTPFIDKSFVYLKIGDYELYIARPELCFIQAAKKLEFLELLLLGFDLCAMYSDTASGRISCTPTTCVENIAKYIDSSHKYDGKVKAKNACKYIINNSNSPMESRLAIIMILPIALGGYGLPHPNFKRRIDY